jgi:hypothetical protein
VINILDTGKRLPIADLFMKDLESILMTIGAKICIASTIVQGEGMLNTDGLIKERPANMSGKRDSGAHLV